MKCAFPGLLLDDDDDWAGLAADLHPNKASEFELVPGLLRTLRELGARVMLEESAYIDRDFSAAYSAFYSTLYQPYLKYCRRLHFFSAGAEAMFELERPEEVQQFIRDRQYGQSVQGDGGAPHTLHERGR